MNMFFGTIAIFITLYTGWRYIPDILQGKIKPHAFSWLPWTILTGVACMAQIKNGEDMWGFGALAASAFVCGVIFLVSLKYGEKNVTREDKIALISCIILIVFWIEVRNDVGAVVLVCMIDTLAFFPTWRKSFLKPQEENISMYLLSSIKSFISLFGLKNPILVNWLYPVFLVIINFSFTLYLAWRRKIIKK